jgi:hypothetical protein
MSSMGEVRECAHCKGSGLCRGGGLSCHKCAKESGSNSSSVEDVACSACGGKGSVWVGPNIVQLPHS